MTFQRDVYLVIRHNSALLRSYGLKKKKNTGNSYSELENKLPSCSIMHCRCRQKNRLCDTNVKVIIEDIIQYKVDVVKPVKTKSLRGREKSQF